MPTNKTITELTHSTPSGGFNLITATGTSNYRVTYADIAEYSSIGTKTGAFTETLTISGVAVSTGAGGAGTTYSAGTGLTLVGTEFNTAGTGVFDQASAASGIFTDSLTISGVAVSTGGGTSNLNNGYILDQSLRTSDDGQLNSLDVTGAIGLSASGYGRFGTVTQGVEIQPAQIKQLSNVRDLTISAGGVDGKLALRGGSSAGGCVYLSDGGNISTLHADTNTHKLGVGYDFSTPQHALHVSGDTALSGYLYDSFGSTGQDGYVLTSTGGGPRWLVSAGGGGSSLWSENAPNIYYTGGSVGIGTTNPTSLLHLSASQPHIQFSDIDDSTESYIRGGKSLTLEADDTNQGANSHIGFEIDGVEKMRITDSGSSGNVGIGTSSPTAKLHVTGDDGRILAPSGVFTSGLFISGVPVSTGAGGGGGGTPGGSDTEIQFNDGGSFEGDSNFIFNKAGGYFSGATGYIDQLYVTGTGFFDSSTVRVGAAAIQESTIDSSAISFSVPRSSASGILTYSGSQAVLAYDTGNRELFVRADPPQPGAASGWNKLAVTFDASAAPNIGAGKGNARGVITTASGINNIIANSDISHGEFNYVKFGTSSNNEAGAIRQGSDGIIEAYSPGASAFQDLSVGISAVVDTADNAPKYSDIEYTDPSTNRVYSVIDGNSDLLGANNLPLVQGFQKPTIGGNNRPPLIDGGSF
jgi:hypothetical protein